MVKLLVFLGLYRQAVGFAGALLGFTKVNPDSISEDLPDLDRRADPIKQVLIVQ
jgi:multisubunit Na+/H+ antiporter MnhC subunit